MAHYKRIKIEGFFPDKILNACLTQGIKIRNARVKDDMEMVLSVTEEDYRKLLKLTKSNYKVTVLSEKGYRPFVKKCLSKKVMLLGMALFLFLMYYQSLFVAEIRIEGYESHTEAKVRESLANAGFYEGCKKEMDISKVKLSVSEDLGNITWMGITYKGSLAEVKLVEGRKKPEILGMSTPCHIVADKEGYVSEIQPKEGVRGQEDGTYVRPGDILISGIVPLKSTAYGTGQENVTERYVHAMGTVKAKIPYRIEFYQDAYELKRMETGNKIFGFEVTIGDKTINTAKLQNYYLNRYETVDTKSKTLVSTLRPFPIRIEFFTMSEVTLEKTKRDKEEILKVAEAQLRTLIKEKLPKEAEITNKSLNFSEEKNIIEITAMIESLQEIGIEQEIIFGSTQSEPASE